MAEKFCFFIRITLCNLSPEKLLFICLLALSGAFLLSLCFCLFLPRYTCVKRLWVVGFYLGVILFESAHALIFKHSFAYPLYSISVCIMLILPTFFILPKKHKLKKEQKELADFLDRTAKQINGQPINSTEEPDFLQQSTFIEETLPSKSNVLQEKLCVTPQSLPKEEKPDFSHVKSVIERLNYFSLTPFDKRQVKELEVAMKRIESGENTPDAKNKINDGLASLLKIMSKYGV